MTTPNSKSAKTEWLKRSPNSELSKKLKVFTWIFSPVVFLLVVLTGRYRIPLPEGFDLSFLPPVYSAMNALAAVAIIWAVLRIKKGDVAGHRSAIVAAMVLSGSFLLCYVAYHITNEPTRFGGEGIAKIFYYILLITHIVLAAVSLPFILLGFTSGITNHFKAHKKMVRWVFPVWLYVALSGPVCYLMLRPYY